MLLSRFAFVAGLLAAASSVLTAQGPPGSALTLQAALDRALTANPAIAAARLRNPIASIEFQKETPKQSYGFSVPLELGGKQGELRRENLRPMAVVSGRRPRSRKRRG
jgi:hypothetical protein